MYKVFGFDAMCYAIVVRFDSFVSAVRFFRECAQHSKVFMIREGDNLSCLFVK